MKTKLIAFVCILLSLLSRGQHSENHASFQVSVEGKGETMFLIPGLSCSANVWKETVNVFKDTYKIHTFTLAGYGGVLPISKDTILPVIKKDLLEYINKHKSENSILMGHSIGGFISLMLAIENETLVSKLIIVDALPFLAGASNPSVTEEIVKSSYGSMKNSYLNLTDEALKQNLQNTLDHMIRDKSKIEEVLKDAIKSDRRTLGVTAFEMMSNDLRGPIVSIKIPTLVMTNWNQPSPQYPNFTKEAKLSIYNQQYKNCSSCTVKIIEKAEHFIMLDNPEIFNTSVKSFIDK
ncbi:alpha/beta hydrolase [bacterium]|nr:alpha/beta hydrolase [bacterium]